MPIIPRSHKSVDHAGRPLEAFTYSVESGILVANKGKGVSSIKAFLTPAEAAEYSGISVSTLSKLRQRGTGCSYVRIGDSSTKAVVLYKRDDLDRWLAKHMKRTTGGV